MSENSGMAQSTGKKKGFVAPFQTSSQNSQATPFVKEPDQHKRHNDVSSQALTIDATSTSKKPPKKAKKTPDSIEGDTGTVPKRTPKKKSKLNGPNNGNQSVRQEHGGPPTGSTNKVHAVEAVHAARPPDTGDNAAARPIVLPERSSAPVDTFTQSGSTEQPEESGAPVDTLAQNGSTQQPEQSTSWDEVMLARIDAAIEAAVCRGLRQLEESEPTERDAPTEGTGAAASAHEAGGKLRPGNAVDLDCGGARTEMGDGSSVPTAEPALPIGSALSAAKRPSAEELTPPDAPHTLLTSPPAVFKRPPAAAAAVTARADPPPDVKRRLYVGDAPTAPHSGTTNADGESKRKKIGVQNIPRPSQKERILSLHRRRTCGTWVQCSHVDCGKWRYLDMVKDPSTLPNVWHCSMSDDPCYSRCSAPQQHIPNSTFPLLVQVRFTVGSVVWARLSGFPWWPAVVDDDPDTEDFFWLDGFSEIPTHYHVTFLDEAKHDVTRAWVAPTNVRKFQPHDDVSTSGKTSCGGVEYRTRIAAAVGIAREALACSLEERRRRYTFVARYRGPWPVFSDSDGEVGHFPGGTGRTASKKKHMAKRRQKPKKDQLAAGRRRPEKRRRSGAGPRFSSVSRSSSSASPGRGDQTISSLMDVVDDIVSQLTQSQSQSQSQSQRSHGRRPRAPGAAGGGRDSSSRSSDSCPSSDSEERGATRRRRSAGSRSSTSSDSSDQARRPKKKAAKVDKSLILDNVFAKGKARNSSPKTKKPAGRGKVDTAGAESNKTKTPTPKAAKSDMFAKPAQKPSFAAKKISNVRVAAANMSQESHTPSSEVTAAESKANQTTASESIDRPSKKAKPAKKPFSVKTARQPTTDKNRPEGRDNQATNPSTEPNVNDSCESNAQNGGTVEVEGEFHSDAPLSGDINGNQASERNRNAPSSGGAISSPEAPSLATLTPGHSATLTAEAPLSPSPRSYTEHQSGPPPTSTDTQASKDTVAESQELFQLSMDGTASGDESDPFDADD